MRRKNRCRNLQNDGCAIRDFVHVRSRSLSSVLSTKTTIRTLAQRAHCQAANDHALTYSRAQPAKTSPLELLALLLDGVARTPVPLLPHYLSRRILKKTIGKVLELCTNDEADSVRVLTIQMFICQTSPWTMRNVLDLVSGDDKCSNSTRYVLKISVSAYDSCTIRQHTNDRLTGLPSSIHL